VADGELVRLNCEAETLRALERGLTHFAPADGAPEWLVPGVWLCAGSRDYLATAFVEVLTNGFVTRGMAIKSPAELREGLEAELPNVSDRLLAHGNGMELPGVEAPLLPAALEPWPKAPYSMQVLVRVSERAFTINRCACALLFASESGRALLVGADVSTLAMVLSVDRELIDRYRKQCEALSVADYLTACGL
jgi:hypothetical protein